MRVQTNKNILIRLFMIWTASSRSVVSGTQLRTTSGSFSLCRQRIEYSRENMLLYTCTGFHVLAWDGLGSARRALQVQVLLEVATQTLQHRAAIEYQVTMFSDQEQVTRALAHGYLHRDPRFSLIWRHWSDCMPTGVIPADDSRAAAIWRFLDQPRWQILAATSLQSRVCRVACDGTACGPLGYCRDSRRTTAVASAEPHVEPSP